MGSVVLLFLLGQSVVLPVIGLLLVPVLIAAVPLVFSDHRFRFAARTTSAIVLVGGGVLTSPTVGLYYLPSGILMAIAAAIGSRRNHDSAKIS